MTARKLGTRRAEAKREKMRDYPKARRSIAYSSDLKTALPGKTLDKLDFYQTRLVKWQGRHDPREEILMLLSVPVLRIQF